MSQSPTTGLDWDVVAEELSGQPDLFSLDLPVALPVMRGAKRLAHTGKIACKDTAMAAHIAVVYHQTQSKRATARACKCDTRTVDAVLRELETGGKLPALKERLPSLLATAAAEAVEWMREIIDQRSVTTEHAATLKALGVVAGIGADKVAAAPPTEHRHVHVHVAEVADSARRYQDMLTPDCASGVTALPRNALHDSATQHATCSPVPEAAPGEDPDVRTETGGGGVLNGPGATEGGGI